MDPKSPKLSLRIEHIGVQSRYHGRWQPVDFCPGYARTSSSYIDTIDTGATTHTSIKYSTGIETCMVHVTLPFDNATDTPKWNQSQIPWWKHIPSNPLSYLDSLEDNFTLKEDVEFLALN